MNGAIETVNKSFEDAKNANDGEKKKYFDKYLKQRDSILQSFLRNPELQKLTTIRTAQKDKFIKSKIDRLKKDMKKIHEIDPDFYNFLNSHFSFLM